MKKKIVVALGSSAWREALVEALSHEDHTVETLEDGQRAQALLTDPAQAPDLMILGPGLSGIGAIDALYQAHLDNQRSRRGERLVPHQLLVSEIRSDVDVLEALRRHGVSAFLHEADPLHKSVATVLNMIFATHRATPRHAVSVGAVLRITDREEEVSEKATVEDLSPGGARVVVKRSAAAEHLFEGQQLELAFGTSEVSVRCRCEIRRLQARKGLFGNRLVLGVRFLEVSEDTTEAIEEIISSAKVGLRDVLIEALGRA